MRALLLLLLPAVVLCDFGDNGISPADKAFYHSRQPTTTPNGGQMLACLTQMDSETVNVFPYDNPVPYHDYIANFFHSPAFTPGTYGNGCGERAGKCPATKLSTCVGPSGSDMCTCNTAEQYKFASCSCRGTCVNRKDSFMWDWQQPIVGGTGKGTAAGGGDRYWSVCVCHDNYFGERCQFLKSEVKMLDIHADRRWLDHFPFLPWYDTAFGANYFMDQVREFEARSSFGLDSYRYNWIASQVYDKVHPFTIWGYQGLTQSCPTGQIMIGMGAPPLMDDGRYLENLNMDELNYPNREFMHCSCDPNLNENVGGGNIVSPGCSNHGSCSLIYVADYYEDNTHTPRKTQYAPPVRGNRFNVLYHTDLFRTKVGLQYPAQWTRCQCLKDYEGLYCERDSAPILRCGNVDTLTSYGNRSSELSTECTCNPTTAVSGPQPVNKRTDRDGFVEGETNKCIRNLDKAICSDKGLFNDVKISLTPEYYPIEEEDRAKELYMCECRDDEHATLNTEVWPTTYDSVNNVPYPQYFGKGCTKSCRAEQCNNRGNCKFKLRTEDIHLRAYTTVPTAAIPGGIQFVNYKQNTQPTLQSQYIIDPLNCKCDDGYSGPTCLTSTKGGFECQGLYVGHPTTGSMPGVPCNNRCSWPNPQLGDPLRLNRTVVYNAEYEVCEVLCPPFTMRHFTDLNTVPDNVECGAALGRGYCPDFNPTSNEFERRCVCFDGYSGPDCGIRSCPRHGQVCGGRGWCDEEKNNCVCQTGTYGDACQFNTPASESECKHGSQPVNNDPTWPLT